MQYYRLIHKSKQHVCDNRKILKSTRFMWVDSCRTNYSEKIHGSMHNFQTVRVLHQIYLIERIIF